jgi:hypothetical protein
MEWELIKEYVGPVTTTDPDNPDAVPVVTPGTVTIRLTYKDHREDREFMPPLDSDGKYSTDLMTQFANSLASNLKEKYDAGQRWV